MRGMREINKTPNAQLSWNFDISAITFNASHRNCHESITI
jgi:hypothetical protein